MRWLDLNRKFYDEHAKPVLIQHFPREFARAACLVDGMGSDVLGTEDKLSYDHHIDPRLFILLSKADFARVGKKMQACVLKEFAARNPALNFYANTHFGHGIVVETPEAHWQRWTNVPRPPKQPQEWLWMHEQDLIHVTNGEVYHDPKDLITSARKATQYFPRDVWKKKLADYCMQYTLAANFNLNRCLLRGDPIGAQILRGFGLRRAMELAFMLNRQYAPYDKWTWRIFKSLPKVAPKLGPKLEAIAATNDMDRVIELFVDVSNLFIEEFVAQKLTRQIKPYTPTKENGYKLLYLAAWDLLNSLPPKLGILEVGQHMKHSQMNDYFMYDLTRNQMLEHVHAPKETWGAEVKPRKY